MRAATPGRAWAGWLVLKNGENKKKKRKSGGNALSRGVVVRLQGVRAGGCGAERCSAVTSPGACRGRQGAEDAAGGPGAAVAEQHEVGRGMHWPPRPAQRRRGEAGGE